jgi:asparagine synthase (glutamine-hydrolysing)
MCGIAGKVSSGAAIAPDLIDRMCAAIAHRGPDSRGIHREDGAELGVQRLRVIDLETGDQPLYNEDESVAVVLNGEIYNYQELRRELQSRGHRLTTRGDTEVIAHLYEEYGAGCVHRLNGMFAFAIWDSRRERLVIGRDRVGKKPLFYWFGNGSLTFASELAALVEDADVPREIDATAIDAFLAYGYVPGPLTIWKGVRKLPPACTLTLERGGSPAIERYWRLDYSQKIDGSPAELEEELRRRVSTAVRRRLVSDVPLGAFLSGGVDSSIVVSEMAAAMTEPVKTFSIGSEVETYNELPRARTIAQLFGTDHHEMIVRPDAIELIPRLVRHYGEPYADTSAIAAFYLARFASRHVTVALNGDGGDENFAGYLRHVANHLTGFADRAPLPLRRLLVRAGGMLPRGPRTITGRANQLLTSLDQNALERYRWHVSVFTPPERLRLFQPGFLAEIDGAVTADVIGRPWREASGSSRLDVMLEVDVVTYLPDDLLAKIDIATMAYSLEGRSPLLDPDVMEFAASLPPSSKLRHLRKKWIFRQAYRDVIPRSILSGAKIGFAIPLAEWLRGDLRAYARDVLLDRRSLDRGYFEEAEVRRILERHESGSADNSLRIWALLMLEHWHELFVDSGATFPATALGALDG